MTNPVEASGNGITPSLPPDKQTGNQADNVEWQLAELVDAIAAEIDQAQDTLSLKSYARGLAFAIKTLSLDIEVRARRSADGRLLFRTVNEGETSATVLKLGFAQVLQSQLSTVRKPLTDDLSAAELSVAASETLEQVASADEIMALRAVGINAMNDLERYTQTSAMLAELSRKTRIPETQLRQWRQLPFLREAKPSSGPPGSTVVIEGGNFGGQPGVVIFRQRKLNIVDWRDTRVTVTLPTDSDGSGLLVVQVGEQISNPLAWETISVDLAVQDITVRPAQPAEDEEILLVAELLNQGNGDAGAFAVEWTLDDQAAEQLPHGPLLAQQRSQESSTRRKVKLTAGTHQITFTADPAGQLPDLNRQNGTFRKQVVVRPLQKLQIGDGRSITQLDPLRNATAGPADLLRLLFRGLGRLDPETGTLIPDLAVAWEMRTTNGGATRCVVRLRDNISFHDGAPLTLDDVKFTYETLMNTPDSPWAELANQTISEVKIVNRSEWTLAFGLKADSAGVFPATMPPALLTIGLVPQATYAANPEQFGQRPIGSGPFQLGEFNPGQSIRLAAFPRYWAGKPRLDRIEVQSEPDEERLIQTLQAQQATVAIFPYRQALADQLSANQAWRVQPVPAAPAASTLLYVANQPVQEWFPNGYDPNWNAHLWYVRSAGQG